MLLWGNLNWAYAQNTMGYSNDSDIGWISYKNRGWSKPHIVGYMESHDEERVMYKNLTYGASSGTYSTKDLATGLSRVEAAAAFFFTIPGPKMIWQFGELGYDYSINTCENGTISDDCRLSPKPVKWSYYNDAKRLRVHNVFKALIDAKKNEPAFSTTDFEINGGDNFLKSIHLNHSDMNVTIVGNFDLETGDINPAFQHNGVWYDFFSSDSLVVTDVNEPITLQHGEFHIYTSKKLHQGTYLDVNENYSQSMLNLYPNPVKDNVMIDSEEAIMEVSIFDVYGKVVTNLPVASQRQVQVKTENLPSGLYILRINLAGGEVIANKFIKN
jgi:hypothetical protein